MTWKHSNSRNGTPASWIEPDPFWKAWAEEAYRLPDERQLEIQGTNPYPPDFKPKTFQDAFQFIFDEAFDVLVEKQIAYGPENIKELDFFGVFSRLASDKVNRIRNLMKGVVVNGTVYVQFPLDLEETVEDTLVDIMNYAAILIALRKGWWGLPLESER